MKDYKRIAVWALEIAVFFFAAFGSFLTKIAPPDQTGASFGVGVMSFFVLIVLLTISALAKGKQTKAVRKRWLIAGVICFILAVPGAFAYLSALEECTYSYPPERPLERHVRGADKDRTPIAEQWGRQHPEELSPADLEANLPYNQIWTPESIRAANRRLLLTYGWLVLALATAVFCLIEANSSSLGPKRSAKAEKITAKDS